VIERRDWNKKTRNAFKYLVFWEEIKLTQPRKKAFRVNRDYPKILRNRKQRIARRLDPKRRWSEQPGPMMKASNIHFEMAERGRALNYGGIGAIHLMGQRLGLAEEIDSRLELLKRHLPYHESDHVLNLAYNALLDGQRLEDIELRRNDEAFLDGLGAQRIPDPTTSGDFTRRFNQDSVLELMEAINATRQRVWEKQPPDFLQQAFIDTDGTLAGTLGECKGGMALSYKGIWGYAPLIITLANTREVLYLVNRPGNVVSHEGCVPWIDRAIELVRPRAAEITLRGDTDFTLSAELDRWDGQGIKFIFGMDAHPKVVQMAESLPETAWKPLERLARYEIATEPRRKPQRIKEAIVRFKGYTNKKLVGESVAEFNYQPIKCGRSYRLVVVRKNISVQKGEMVLLEDIKYFFYITNHSAYCAEQIVALANQRCDQENVIEQLKNGVNAMRMPVDDLLSNWAYMVMSALAWNLKAWYGLLMPNRQRGLELLGMEFRRFLHLIVLLPAQIVRSGRRIIYRIMGYNSWLKDFFASWENLRRMAPA
jgi:Transposase DDE domain group 1